MMQPGAEALVREAHKFKRLARASKRSVSYHRKHARECMEQYAALAKQLESMGITLIAGEEDNHGRNGNSA